MSTFKVPLVSFFKQTAKIAVGAEAKFGQDVLRERLLKKKVTTLSSLTDRFLILSGTFQDSRRDERKRNFSSHRRFTSATYSKYGAKRYSDN